MCPSSSRRLLEEGSFVKSTSVEFLLTNQLESMDTLLRSLEANKAVFAAAISVPPADVNLTSFQYSTGGGSTQPGSVSAYVEFALQTSLVNPTSLSLAISESLSELIGAALPAGSAIECTTNIASQVARSNVTISVSTDLDSAQSTVSNFLVADASVGDLPNLISKKTALPVEYVPGYVPIVWTSPTDPVVQVLNLLPYILAGVGVAAVLIALLCYRYRLVVSSWWESVCERREGWADSGAVWLPNFERGKSELSSTPDTATNVDPDEFNDLCMPA